VEADKDRITQVLSNLLSNAIKFTNQGKIYINTFEKIQDKGDSKKEVLVSVTNTGSGIKICFNVISRHRFRIIYLQSYHIGPWRKDKG
jgi:signal transduction histidine kinase